MAIQYCTVGKHFVELQDYNAAKTVCLMCDRQGRWDRTRATLEQHNVCFELIPTGHWRATLRRNDIATIELIASGRDKSLCGMNDAILAQTVYKMVYEHIEQHYTPDPFILFDGQVRTLYLTLPMGSLNESLGIVLRRLKSEDRLPTLFLPKTGRWTFWCPKIDMQNPMLKNYVFTQLQVFEPDLSASRIPIGFTEMMVDPVYSANHLWWENIIGRYFLHVSLKGKGTYIFDLNFA